MLPSQKQFRRIVPKIMIDNLDFDQILNIWIVFKITRESIMMQKKFDRVDTSRSSFYSTKINSTIFNFFTTKPKNTK